MKKLFTKVSVFLCAITMTFSLSSCGNELVQAIIGQVITELLSSQGKTYDFRGTAGDAYALVSNNGGKDFMYVTGSQRVEQLSMTLPVKVGQTAQINFPETTVNGIKFPATTVSNLATKAAGSSSIQIEVGDNTTADGTLVLSDGSQYPIYNIVLDNMLFTSDDNTLKCTLASKQIQLWYGTPETALYVVNYRFSGNGIEQQSPIFGNK